MAIAFRVTAPGPKLACGDLGAGVDVIVVDMQAEDHKSDIP